MFIIIIQQYFPILNLEMICIKAAFLALVSDSNWRLWCLPQWLQLTSGTGRNTGHVGMTARKHTITRDQSNLVKYLNYCKTAFHEYPSINSVIQVCSIHNYLLFDLHLLARVHRMQINSPCILATCWPEWCVRIQQKQQKDRIHFLI